MGTVILIKNEEEQISRNTNYLLYVRRSMLGERWMPFGLYTNVECNSSQRIKTSFIMVWTELYEVNRLYIKFHLHYCS